MLKITDFHGLAHLASAIVNSFREKVGVIREFQKNRKLKTLVPIVANLLSGRRALKR